AAHRPPGDAHELRDRRLVAVLQEPRDLVLERPREVRIRCRPAHLLDADRAAPSTLHAPPRRRSQAHLPSAKVQLPPLPRRPAVVDRRLPVAARAPWPAASANIHDEPLRPVDPGLLDDESREREELTE